MAPRRTEAAPRLRSVPFLAKRIWTVCIGVKRWHYEVEHPRGANEPMPTREALRIANDCFNPLSFLGGK